jgi:hypothetical protein
MPHRAWKAMFRGFVAKHWQNNGIANTEIFHDDSFATHGHGILEGSRFLLVSGVE